MRVRPGLITIALTLLLTACGHDRYDHYYGPDAYYLPTGSFHLSPTYSSMGCGGDYNDFLNRYYGYIVEPLSETADIYEAGLNTIEIRFEETGISITLYPSYYDPYIYEGSFYGNGLVYDCYIDEMISVKLKDTGREIYLDINSYYTNSAYSNYCPFYSFDCTNRVSFAGYPS